MDTFYWDVSELEPGHRYALVIYGSEDCDFIGEMEMGLSYDNPIGVSL